jgi:hypothetical protein
MAIFVQDHGEATSRPVPISRLFPVFTTDYDGLRQCSVHAQMTPQERAETIVTFLNQLSGVQYGNCSVSIQQSYLTMHTTHDPLLCIVHEHQAMLILSRYAGNRPRPDHAISGQPVVRDQDSTRSEAAAAQRHRL